MWNRMQIEYELTKDDLFAFQWRSAYKSKQGRRGGLMVYLVCFLSFFFMSSLPTITTDGFHPENFDLRFLVTTFVFVAILYWAFNRMFMRRAINQMLKQHEQDKGQLGRHQIVLDETGVIESTAVGETRTSWSGIDRVEQNEDYIFLYTQPHAAHVVPKRAFADTDDAQSFYEMARIKTKLVSV